MKCVYCNAGSYGIGCPHSPTGKHVHMDNKKRCIYCGSANFGIGCPHSPGKRHIHGIDFNAMLGETTERSITAGYLISKLGEPITETKAYILGLVDKDGKRLRKPETIEEKRAFTPTDAYIFKLRRSLGPHLELLNSALYLENLSEIDTSIESYEKEVRVKPKIDKAVEYFNDVINEAIQAGLSTEHVENLIIRTFMDKKIENSE